MAARGCSCSLTNRLRSDTYASASNSTSKNRAGLNQDGREVSLSSETVLAELDIGQRLQHVSFYGTKWKYSVGHSSFVMRQGHRKRFAIVSRVTVAESNDQAVYVGGSPRSCPLRGCGSASRAVQIFCGMHIAIHFV